MQDPFANKSDNRFHREVQIWMTVLMCLLVAFLYLAVKRMTGSNEEIPAHILRAGVARVTPPITGNAGTSLSPDRLRVSNVPPILTTEFSSNTFTANETSIPDSKATLKSEGGTLEHRKLPAGIPSIGLKPIEIDGYKPTPELPSPKPDFDISRKIETVEVAADEKADEKAEAIGRRRAQQLAAMTNGLPKRLNKIQSSVERATVALSWDSSTTVASPRASSDNAFVPSKLTADVASAPDRAPIQIGSDVPTKPMPVKPDPFRLIPVKPDLLEPRSAKAIPIKPIPVPNSVQTVENKTFSVEPLRSTRVVSESNDIKTPKRPIEPSGVDLKKHFVQAGDSFFTIAQQHYGDARWFRALRLANQAMIENADELPVGQPLVIPSTKELAEQFPAYAVSSDAQQPTEAKQRIYVTEAGDTLFDIARRKTGQGSRFYEIIDENQFRLPAAIRASDRLPAGVRLVLPESKLQ